MKKQIPQGDIEIYVHFENDPSMGTQSWTYTLQAPDFRMDWTETEQMLKTYIEEKRKQIQELYEEFAGEHCLVTFSFELIDSDLPTEEELNHELHNVIEHCRDLIAHGHSSQATKCYSDYMGCSLTQAAEVLNIKLH